ncbi:OsmC family protein [Proteus columbae]|uniref:OsmC family protein n=1 Tax=Proteus columbae TaxID=1987580 RepID=UPI00288B0D43|nr:OsmC family protein [Proteus columbae]
MKAEVKWIEDLKFVGKTDKNQEIIFGGGDSTIVSPMEMVLIAAGGCSAIDVVSILRKGRHQVTDCEVKLTSERREEAPRLFTDINLHFIVSGKELTDKIVERAVQLSAEKYCSVSLMLGKAANITHSFEIKDAD